MHVPSLLKGLDESGRRPEHTPLPLAGGGLGPRFAREQDHLELGRPPAAITTASCSERLLLSLDPHPDPPPARGRECASPVFEGEGARRSALSQWRRLARPPSPGRGRSVGGGGGGADVKR